MPIWLLAWRDIFWRVANTILAAGHIIMLSELILPFLDSFSRHFINRRDSHHYATATAPPISPPTGLALLTARQNDKRLPLCPRLVTTSPKRLQCQQRNDILLHKSRDFNGSNAPIIYLILLWRHAISGFDAADANLARQMPVHRRYQISAHFSNITPHDFGLLYYFIISYN
jgi:hypothetical protein